jgi:hypothetical protein
MVAAVQDLNKTIKYHICRRSTPRIVPGCRGWWPDILRDAIDLLRGDNASEDTQTGQGVTWFPTEESTLWSRGLGYECQPDILRDADTTPTAEYTARGSPDLPQPKALSVDQQAADIMASIM